LSTFAVSRRRRLLSLPELSLIAEASLFSSRCYPEPSAGDNIIADISAISSHCKININYVISFQ
jgi:hypothetical protein